MTDITTSSTSTSSTTKLPLAESIEALTKAVHAGRDKEVEALLPEIKNNISAEQYINMLNLTIQKNAPKVFNQLILSLTGSLCDLLLKAKREISIKDKKIELPHPLIMAIRKNGTTIIKCILENQKVSTNSGILGQALRLAAESDKIEIVEMIMDITKAQYTITSNLLQNASVLPEVKFILNPKATLVLIEKNEGNIEDLFQIIRHVSTDDNKKALWEKDFFACLENKLNNTLKSGRVSSIETILDNQDVPVTLSMVAKAFQLAKKEKAKSEIIKALEYKIQALSHHLNEKEKNIFELSIEHDLDETFALALKIQPLEQAKADKLFNDFKVNNKVAMQQKLLESNLLSKECILQVLNETADKNSQNAPFFDLIINATQHKETTKEFVDIKLASGSFDIVHRILLTPTASLSQSDVIAQMNADHKKKIFFLIRNPELIKVLLAQTSVAEKFDLLLESFNSKNHEKVLMVYNNASIGEKAAICTQFKLTNSQHKVLFDDFFLMRPSTEIFNIIHRIILDGDLEPNLINILLTKLNEKQLIELAAQGAHFKDAVIAFISSTSAYPEEKIKALLEEDSEHLSRKEIIAKMKASQKTAMLFKGVSEEVLDALLNRIKLENKISMFRKYSTPEHKAIISDIYLHLSAKEKGLVLSQLATEGNNDLLQILKQTNIEGIIEALASAEKPQPILEQTFLKTLTSREIAQLVQGNACLANLVKDFLDAKLVAGDTAFVAAVFSSPLKNLKRADLVAPMTLKEKMDTLSQAINKQMISPSLVKSLPLDKKLELMAEFFNKKKQDLVSAIYECYEAKEKVAVLLELTNRQKYEWVNFLMPQDIKASISLFLLNLQNPPSALTNKLLDVVYASKENLNYFLDFFQDQYKKNILDIYKSIASNTKIFLLLSLISNSKIKWAEYLVLNTLEESCHLILKSKEIDIKLMNILLEQIDTLKVEKLSDSIKNNLAFFMLMHTSDPKKRGLLNDNVLLHTNLKTIFQENVVKKKSADDKYTMLVNFSSAGCDNLIKSTLNFITKEQKLKLLDQYVNQDKGRIVSNVFKQIPLQEMTEILLAVTKQQNHEKILFVINSFYVKSEAYANARTGKVKQLIQSSPALKEAMISFIKKQFDAKNYDAIHAILRSPLKEIIQEQFISSMSEENKFNVLIAAANKRAESTVKFLLESIQTSEQRFKLFAKCNDLTNQFALSMIFKTQDGTGDLKKKFDMYTMAIQQKNVPLIAFFRSVEDKSFISFIEKVSSNNKKDIFCELVSMNQQDWLKQWLLEDIEESMAIVLSLYKEDNAPIENKRKLLDILLEVLPAKHLTKFLEENSKDMTNHIRTQLAFLQTQQKPLSIGACNILQFMTEKDSKFIKEEFIDKMNEKNKFDLLLSMGKNTIINNGEDIVGLVLDSFTPEQKQRFVRKYIDAKSLQAELSKLYLSLTSEEMVEIFTMLDKDAEEDLEKKNMAKKIKTNWVNAVEFEKIQQDKNKTIMLAQKEQPLLTSALLKLLSADQRTKLFTSVDTYFSAYLQECMTYDEETYKMFLSAAKQKNQKITDSFVKDGFLKANLLRTAKLQGHQDVVTYINADNKGEVTSQLKDDKTSPVNNPPEIALSAGDMVQNTIKPAITNNEQHKILVEYMSTVLKTDSVTQPIAKTKNVVEPVISAEQQKLLDNLAAQRSALSKQESPMYTPGRIQQNQLKQEDPRYTPGYVQQVKKALSPVPGFTTQLPSTSHAPRGGVQVLIQQTIPPVQQVQPQVTTHNAQTSGGFMNLIMNNPILGSMYSTMINNLQPPAIERVSPPTQAAPTRPQQQGQPNNNPPPAAALIQPVNRTATAQQQQQTTPAAAQQQRRQNPQPQQQPPEASNNNPPPKRPQRRK